MDIIPTALAAAGITPPKERNGESVIPLEGTPLMPTFRGRHLPKRVLGFEHQEARGLRKDDWKLVWGKRMPNPPKWELYNMQDDRQEQTNLAAEKPELVKKLAAEWEDWATRVGVE